MYNAGTYVGRRSSGGGGGGSTSLPNRITAANFIGNTYTPPAGPKSLVNKTAMINFDVFSAGAYGGLLEEDDGYTFDSPSGTLTMPPGKYMILKY